MSDDKNIIPEDIGFMSTEERAKLDMRVKLQLLAAQTRAVFERDPRAGGFAFVGRPRTILQLLVDGNVGPLSSHVRLAKPIMIGHIGADEVATWEGVPIIVRSTVCDNNLHCVPLDKIPPSSPVDRQRAGQLRVSGHAGQLRRLMEA